MCTILIVGCSEQNTSSMNAASLKIPEPDITPQSHGEIATASDTISLAKMKSEYFVVKFKAITNENIYAEVNCPSAEAQSEKKTVKENEIVTFHIDLSNFVIKDQELCKINIESADSVLGFKQINVIS